MMFRQIMAAAGLLVSVGAPAGGIDRSGQDIGVLFKPDNYLEAGILHVAPTVTGVDFLGGPTGKVTKAHSTASMAAKFQLSDKLSMALLADEPWGARLEYGTGSRLLGGTSVNVSSRALRTLARYRFDSGFSVHGGLNIQEAEGEVQLKGLAYGAVSGYRMRLLSQTRSGFIGGGAFEIPDIALRVALTYHSPVRYRFETRESGPLAPLNGTSTTAIDTPRSVNLDFQTGIHPNTLLFGSLRWVKWSEFRVNPALFTGLTGEGLINLKNAHGYTLGLAQRLDPHWAVSLSAHQEPRGPSLNSPLSPVNGRRSLTLAASYDRDRFNLTAGLSMIQLGDAILETGTPDTPRAVMSGNHALAFGVRTGWRF